eukprot:scaffold35234_cov28-Tisochrysis_lutea.AAC.1
MADAHEESAGCAGIAPPPAEDAPYQGDAGLSAEKQGLREREGGFSLSRGGSEGKSELHWIPMLDLRASHASGRVNARLLLVSPALHARVLFRVPLVLLVWAALIVSARPAAHFDIPPLHLAFSPTRAHAPRAAATGRRDSPLLCGRRTWLDEVGGWDSRLVARRHLHLLHVVDVPRRLHRSGLDSRKRRAARRARRSRG